MFASNRGPPLSAQKSFSIQAGEDLQFLLSPCPPPLTHISPHLNYFRSSFSLSPHTPFSWQREGGWSLSPPSILQSHCYSFTLQAPEIAVFHVQVNASPMLTYAYEAYEAALFRVRPLVHQLRTANTNRQWLHMARKYPSLKAWSIHGAGWSRGMDFNAPVSHPNLSN